MKISSISTLLSVVSIGAVTALYLKVDDLQTELRLSRSSRADVSRGQDGEDDRIRDYGRSVPRSEGESPRAPSTNESPSVASGSKRPAARSGRRREGTLEERLARLEKRDEKRSREPHVSRLSVPRFARTVKDLSKRLKLTQAQEDRVRETVQRGKERIDAILAIPGADGKSPKQGRAERQKKIEEAMADPEKRGGIFALAMSGQSRLKQKIPGSNETYREGIDRIKSETRDEISSSLSHQQQEEFKDTNIDPMLGGGGSSTMTFVATTELAPSGSDGDGAAVLIEESEATEAEEDS